MSDERNALWGDSPALPKLPIPKSRLEVKIEARGTPAGREYELRLLRAELVAFLLGLVSIIVGAMWLLILVAGALVGIGALNADNRFDWVQTELFGAVAATGLLVCIAYMFQEIGLATDRIAALLTFTAPSVVVTMATGILFCHAFVALSAAAGIATRMIDRRQWAPSEQTEGPKPDRR